MVEVAVVRTYALALLAALALAGCAASGATYSAPVSYPVPSRPLPPPGPNIYDTAPSATVFSELIACNNGSGSNLGEIGYRSESLLYTPYIETPAGGLLRNPTEGACLSSGFGWRGSLGSGRQHNGLDLANANGGFIYAAGDGRITYADYRGGYGNVVEIDHGYGVRTLYAHLSEIDQNLRPGDSVRSGEPIARMGMSGNATGIHLHYEVWVNGLLVDPLHFGRPPVYVSAPAREPILLPETTAISSEAAPEYSEPVMRQAGSTMSTGNEAPSNYPEPVTLQPPTYR
jgi:murein DD-endopeptidase MepM/ murein hydrolase activator NlpD